MYDLIRRLIAFLLPIVRTAALEVAADVVNDIAYPQRRRPYSPYNRLRPRTSYSQRPRGYTDLVDYAKKDVAETEELFTDHNLVDEDDSVTYTFPVQVQGNISREAALEALQHHVNTDTHPCFTYAIRTVD